MPGMKINGLVHGSFNHNQLEPISNSQKINQKPWITINSNIPKTTAIKPCPNSCMALSIGFKKKLSAFVTRNIMNRVINVRESTGPFSRANMILFSKSAIFHSQLNSCQPPEFNIW